MSAQTPTFTQRMRLRHPLWEIVQRPTKEESKMEYYYEAAVVSLGTSGNETMLATVCGGSPEETKQRAEVEFWGG